EEGAAVGGVTATAAAAILCAAAATPTTPTPTSARQDRFHYLLRTYPQRSPRDTLAQVERLVEEGDFPEHDRAEYWLGSALHAPFGLWPLPAEARIVLPVLAVLALLSVRQDPAPRAAIFELCTGAALLVTLSGLRLRAASPRGASRFLHAAGTLAALVALAYV